MSIAPAGGLVWTEETRALVSPRRSHGVREPLPADGMAAELLHSIYALRSNAIIEGVAHATGEAKALQKAVIDHFTKGTAMSEAAAAASAALLTYETEFRKEKTRAVVSAALVDVWIEEHGPAFAVRASAASTLFGVRRGASQESELPVPSGDPTARPLVLVRHQPMQVRDPRNDEPEPLWEALRLRVATMPDEAWREARAARAALAKDASIRLAARLAFAFPDDAEAGAEVARAALEGDQRSLWRPLLHTLSDRELIERIIEAAGELRYELAPAAFDVADALGLDAETAILAIANSEAFDITYGLELEREAIVKAVALLPTDRAAAWLLERFDEKAVRPAVTALLSRSPRLGVVALARAIAGKKSTANEAALLERIVRASPEAAIEAARELDGPAAKVVADLVEKNVITEEAAPQEIPSLLVSPPWAPAPGTKRPAKKKLPVVALDRLPFEEWVCWTDVPKPEFFTVGSTAKDAGTIAALERKLKSGQQIAFWELAGISDDAARDVFSRFPIECWMTWGLDEELPSQLARFGVAAIEPCLRFAKRKPADAATALEAIVSPRVAPFMAHILARVKRARRIAERWLVRNARVAAMGLLFELFGKQSDAPSRASAARAVRFLAARGKRDVLEEVAHAHGDEVVRGLELALSADSLAEGAPSKPPKLPGWFDAAALPRPRLAGTRKALPLDAVQHVAEMLAFTDVDEPYAGLEVVREACDAASLGDFAWAIFQAWTLAGYPMDEKWAFFAVGHFGRDEHAQRLTPLIRGWPTEGAFPRAVVGLDVLATMKSDVALMLLHGISEKVKSRPLMKKAKEKMDSVAESLGLTAEELADRLVPTLGLDEDGSRVLDFGKRSFRVGFDENLRPFVQEIEDGKIGGRLAELPKPGKNDDTALATNAHDEWKALKKAAKLAATQQVSRFELAMIGRRRWDVDSFATHLAGRPLVKHLARRLVWGAYGGAGSGACLGTFRIAEDGTYANADDDTFTMPDGARVGVVHPLEIDPKTLGKWGERLSEYGILQPFSQIGREVPRSATVDEARRFTPVDSLKLLGLERRGWRRGAVGDGGVVWQLDKEAGASRATLVIEPGFFAGDPKMYPTQTARSLAFAGASTGPTDAPDAIFLAEVVADLRAVGAVA